MYEGMIREQKIEYIVLTLTNCREFYEYILPRLVEWYEKDEPSSKLNLIVWKAIIRTYPHHGVRRKKYTKEIGQLSEAIWEKYEEEVLSTGVKRQAIKEKQNVKEETDNDGWIEWHGGECPVAKEVKVEYVLRSGKVYHGLAGFLCWKHENLLSDVTSYRVVEKDLFAELKKAHKEGKRIQLNYAIGWRTLICKKIKWIWSATEYRIHPDDVEGEMQYMNELTNNTTEKETKAMKSIKIESQTNIVINGIAANAANSSDEDIFQAIASMEKEVEKLGEIKNKPKKLEAEIKRMEGEIKALVNYVDSRETK